jgi:hypothetical protein
MTHTDLRIAIENYVENTDAIFTYYIDNFMRNAEDRIFSLVEMPSFWKTYSGNTVASQKDYSVTGMLDVLSVRVSQTEADSDGPWVHLLRKDYNFLDEAYPGSASGATTGNPKYYAISSAQVATPNTSLTIRMAPAPSAIFPYVIDYYGKVAEDSITSGASDKETWLSVAFPDVLLYGCLFEAYTFMKGEPDLLQLYEKRFMEGVQLIKSFGEGRMPGDSYTEGHKRSPVQ